jgi:Tfp pilus assembly protein PilF
MEPERPTVTAQDLDEQRALLESLVQADPSNPFARLTLAVAYSSTDPERALNEYRRLIKDSDELVPEIIERLREMIADGDAPPRVYRVLGDAYMKLGQFDLAMAEFQRALTARTRGRK